MKYRVRGPLRFSLFIKRGLHVSLKRAQLNRIGPAAFLVRVERLCFTVKGVRITFILITDMANTQLPHCPLVLGRYGDITCAVLQISV